MLPRDLPRRLRHDGYAGVGPEPHTGVLQLRVVSATKIRRYVPGGDEVLVSFCSHMSERARIQHGWVDTLFLVFDDTGAFAVPRVGAQGMTPADAIALLRFVERHRTRHRLVLQCEAGVSRSRSLAAVISQVFQLPYRWTVLNHDVFALVCREADALA